MSLYCMYTVANCKTDMASVCCVNSSIFLKVSSSHRPVALNSGQEEGVGSRFTEGRGVGSRFTKGRGVGSRFTEERGVGSRFT